MKFRPRNFVAMVLLLGAQPIFGAEPTPHETEDKIYIVLQERGAKAREMALDKKVINQVSSMAKLELAPLLALSALTVAGVDCCPPIEKLSDTVWRCCDGTKTIVTNNTSVSKILTLTRELKRSDWEAFKRQEGVVAGDAKVLQKLLERKPQA